MEKIRIEQESSSASYARSDENGKDTLYFVNKEDADTYTGTATLIQAEEDTDNPPEQQAYNEETGEINWDCPCIAGMTKEPCGDKFKAAFSCFVYSKNEPKGTECIEQFREMQTCFKEHPEIYGDEIQDEDDETVKENLEGESESNFVVEKAETQNFHVIQLESTGTPDHLAIDAKK